MAEKGAHLTQTVQIKPSIFDFIAQESLNELLHPAAKKIVDVLSFRYPVLQSAYRWFDEYFLLVHFLLQYHYLKKYRGTFSESFYGLQRVSLSGSGKKILGRKELVLSLAMVTLFPYLRMKLHKKAEQIYLDELPTVNKKSKKVLLKTFVSADSGFHICLQIMNFVQHLRYLSGKSEVNSPALWAARVKLKYADEEEPNQDGFYFRDLIPQVLRRSLEVGAFFLQFYQWWQTEQGGTLGTLSAPPAPEMSDDGGRFMNVCPICQKKRSVETALSVSGFVFCFKCVTAHLQKEQHCPVTRLPATVDDLIRLYPPE